MELRKDCGNLKISLNSFTMQANEMDKKLTDVEAGSMLDNLMFYKIKEGGDAEKCDSLVKTLITDMLHVRNTHDIILGRGQKTDRTRPIVDNFTITPTAT